MSGRAQYPIPHALTACNFARAFGTIDDTIPETMPVIAQPSPNKKGQDRRMWSVERPSGKKRKTQNNIDIPAD
jgi:hypothetical protein